MKQCSVESCDKYAKIKGYCDSHYSKDWYQKNRDRVLVMNRAYKLSNRATISNNPEYTAWYNMNIRCYSKKYVKSYNYLGRGITVCDEWRESFSSFYEDMGDRPGKGYSLDRIDNDGNYEPGNVRWATARQQMQNTRKSKYEYPGIRIIKTKTLGDRWLARITINNKCLHLGSFSTKEEAIQARKKADQQFAA